MPAWKQFEREAAKLINGKRFWANAGESVDVEGPVYLAQCKLRQRLSLEELTQLVEQSERDGQARGKIGLAIVKVRRGQGRSSPTLVVMSAETWEKIQNVV